MAHQGVQLDRDHFCCCICLDLLKDPVTIPCGHSYCMSCIRSYWDGKDVPSCPQCRQTFTPRPVLVKSTMLAALVEDLKKTGPGHVSLQSIQQMIQDRERDLKVLQQRVEAINRSADRAVEHSEKIFSEVKQQIRSRQEAEVHQAEELQKKMEQKIAELRGKVTEVQQLSPTEDSVHFLQKSSSLPGVSESTDVPTEVRPPRCFEDVSVAVSEVRDKVEGILKEEGSKISLTVTEDVLLSRPEPKTRDEFLQYSRHITLDPNTANRLLLLSEGNRTATGVGTNQFYPSHPDRFIRWEQVLSRESLTGRCYLEVEWRGRVSIAVTYKNISRTGSGGECGFGHNDKSWALDCTNNSYIFRHNQMSSPAPGPLSSRVGVYLDHGAGVLSFHGISGTMVTLLHRVQTSFTQTLHPGFIVHYGGSVALCELN